MMTSRERVIRTLAHMPPDRVPTDLGSRCSTIVETGYEKLKKYLAIKSKTRCFTYTSRCVEPDELVLQKLGVDTRYLHLERPKPLFTPDKSSFIDEWGVQAKKVRYYYERIGHPLRHATINDLKHYKWPRPPQTKGLKEHAQYLYENTDCALIFDLYNPMFEMAYHLRGFEQYYIDLAINPEFIHALLQKVLAITKTCYEEALGLIGDYIQGVWAGDDLGQQYALMMSPKMYRKMLKPYQKALFQHIKSMTKAKLIYHSDGTVREIIPDLIEIGIDALNPIQVSASGMDSKELKREFGDKLSFWGGIDTQTVLPRGTVEQVKEEVKTRIADLAPGGGYVLTSVHNIQPDVPPENIIAMFEAAKEFGKYPITV